MSTSHLDTQLEQLEIQCQALRASLLSGNAVELQAGSTALQRLTVEFSQMAVDSERTEWDTPSRVNRIKALASGIAILREGLLRQLAYVQRGLEIVVPATREKATYATGGAYGSPVRQSGSLSFLSA